MNTVVSTYMLNQYIFNVANGKPGSRVFSVPANGSATRLLFRIEKVRPRTPSFCVNSAHNNLLCILLGCTFCWMLSCCRR